jgi:hypothetical protein
MAVGCTWRRGNGRRRCTCTGAAWPRRADRCKNPSSSLGDETRAAPSNPNPQTWREKKERGNEHAWSCCDAIGGEGIEDLGVVAAGAGMTREGAKRWTGSFLRFLYPKQRASLEYYPEGGLLRNGIITATRLLTWYHGANQNRSSWTDQTALMLS